MQSIMLFITTYPTHASFGLKVKIGWITEMQLVASLFCLDVCDTFSSMKDTKGNRLASLRF